MKKPDNTKANIKKLAIFLVLMLAVSNIPGAGGTLSLEDIQLVSLLIFDCDDEGYTVAFVSNNPQEGGSGESGYRCVVGRGQRLGSCIVDAQSQLEKTIYFGQVEVIWFGNALMRNSAKLSEAFDYIERNPFINYAVSLGCFSGGADAFLERINKDDKLIIDFLDNILLKEPSRTFLSRNLYHIARLAGTFSLPNIELNDSGLNYRGFVVCRDYLRIGSFDRADEISYMVLTGDASEEYFSCAGGEYIIKRAKPKMSYEGGRLTIELEAKCAVITLSAYDAIDTADLMRLEAELSEALAAKCQTVADKISALDCDVLGVGDYLYRFHTDEYKKLLRSGSVLANVDIAVTAKAIIVNNGIMF